MSAEAHERTGAGYRREALLHAQAKTWEAVNAIGRGVRPGMRESEAKALAGEVLEINEALVDSPELVNEDPLGKGWFFRMQPADAGALEGLLDRAAYENLLKANG